ncbi:uncharacterized protein LOC127653107 isoform X2 [Xyrauchen texanus]|uniref:uncharacterized protein LOC127653107 isoform X2 n=1 Tax=Xyrauchen texanus TaxID=154827 RepID=UPI00224201B7|nr:uncharacterized protein LOC127653107 isoform X2 [Xyrauchen texanus]
MDKRIAVFIFSCILLLKTAVGTNSAKPSSAPGANKGSDFDKPSSSPPTDKMSTSTVISPASSSPKPLTTVSSRTNMPSENHKDSKESSEKRYLWILLPALCILLAALIFLKFKCKKVQNWTEMTDNGTENASFQRTETNKDGVLLLGINKTAIGEDNSRSLTSLFMIHLHLCIWQTLLSKATYSALITGTIPP